MGFSDAVTCHRLCVVGVLLHLFVFTISAFGFVVIIVLIVSLLLFGLVVVCCVLLLVTVCQRVGC